MHDYLNCYAVEKKFQALGQRALMLQCGTTHGSKAKRNAHLSSGTSTARNFTSKDGVQYGWHEVQEVYKRDLARTSRGAAPDTDLTDWQRTLLRRRNATERDIS